MLGRSALLAATRSKNYGNWLGNYSNVSLLLRGNSTLQLIPQDESPAPKTITAVGNASVTTAVARWNQGSGGSSLAFDGNGDFLQCTVNTDFLFGSLDFTIELWVYLNSYSSISSPLCGIWSDSSDSPQSWLLWITSSGGIVFLADLGVIDDAFIINNAGNVPIGQWVHIAIVRAGSNFLGFINGILVSTPFSSSAALQNGNGTVPLEVGGYSQASSASKSLNGYIDDLRITKGIARYTSNFTPPPAELPNF